MFDSVESTVVDAESGKVNSNSVEIFVKVMVREQVEAKELVGGCRGYKGRDKASDGREEEAGMGVGQ